MRRRNDKKNILIIFLLAIVFVMSVGFALFSSEPKVTATGTVSGDWNVHFVNDTFTPTIKTDGVDVTTILLNDEALEITLDATFEKPGDTLQYVFKVENTGSIDAYLKNVTATGVEGNTEAIKLSYEVKDNTQSTVYAAGSISGVTPVTTTSPTPDTALLNKQVIEAQNTTTENNYLTVTLEYVDTTTSVATEASSTYTLSLQYEQTPAN